MAAEITKITPLNSPPQEYDSKDINLITPSLDVLTSFDQNSYIECYIYDSNNSLLSSDLQFTRYKVFNNGYSAEKENDISKIEIDINQTLTLFGFTQGEYIITFNFLSKKIGDTLQKLYITEISSDRTELRLDSVDLSSLDIIEKTNNFIRERENSDYFIDFYLNFGENNLILANNIELDSRDITNPTILIKLYNPLPSSYDLNSTLWVVNTIEEQTTYKAVYPIEPVTFNDTVKISGPNFNLDLKDQVNNSTLELSYNDLISTTFTSSLNQINSLLEEKEIDINIDYTNFSNFIHFSSAKTRLENFYYKVGLIQEYSSSISILNNILSSSNNTNNSKELYEAKINQIITNFDGYDYYLYYSSGPYAWPKTNTEPPYQLYSPTDPIVLNWLGSNDELSPYYGGLLLSASQYDYSNPNYLFFSIPEYLRNDPSNENYQLFIDMVGQHYDNIWIYYKDVTNKYNTDNRLEYGISKDIVADAIRDFGIKLYQNNFSNEDLYTAFLGLTPEGALFPFPNITGSLPTPSGYEYINQFISASNDYIPLDDVNKSLYKRIYHNLPYLLKSKGTLPGLRALITSYGIPDTILRINEYGGKDKVNSNDWDYWQNEFNYAFNTEGNNFLFTPWPSNPDWNASNGVPSTIEFRFKAESFPPTYLSQSILSFSNSPGNYSGELTLQYTGSGLSSGSYSGSAINPYYQHANLTFYPSSSDLTTSASIYLPFFNNGWWSVMLKSGSNGFELYAGNNIYEGGDNNTELGFYSSSSISSIYDPWINGTRVYFATGSLFNLFSGSLQEIRYYKTELSESVFKDYIMNPYSTEGNSLNSSPNELIFRASLGGELYTESISIHPKITGSWQTTQSFLTGNSDFSFNQSPIFTPNEEYFFYDQPIAGIKNTISDKIRIENNVIPEGDTLSPFMSLSQMSNVSQSYTQNINYLEVAFSPQNEINEDIMDQIGSFNIGEFIGDPRLRSSSAVTYPALDQLRNEYFQKYTKNYNLTDFIRLIKFFDNSLFKMIRDFVPARTSLASGIVVKQHLLERNKYPQPQMSWEDLDIPGTLKPQWNGYEEGTVENFSGGTGGVFDQFNSSTNTSQSWIENITTLSGSVLILHDSQDEFYNGEFSGSNILISNGILNEAYPLSYNSFEYKQVHYYGNPFTQENDIFENNFLDNITSPKNGEILFFHESTFKLFPLPITITRNTKYLKISKFDCNGVDNSVALDETYNALIYNPLSNSYVSYNLIILNEQPTYYSYQLTQTQQYIPSQFPNQVLDYTVSASITSSYNVGNGSPKTIINWDSTLPGTNLPHYGTPYFNTSSGILTFENTPNTQLILSASINTSGNDPTSRFIRLIQNRNGIETIISQDTYNAGGVDSTLLTASLYPIQNDQYYIQLTKTNTGVNINITSADILITQSRAVSSSNCEPVIFEPYPITPNFYNSNENALLNNISDLRDSSYYMDVDYTKGATEPVNFDNIISGSATRAKVQDSNYTSKRVTIPRYEGSKSTSQFLNKWTDGDVGTFGKTPTVESTKTAIAYCDWIGGWPPDRMNASAAHILYLIHPDGTVTIPNVSENSLSNTQGNFVSGERFTIQTKDSNAGDPIQYRNIIRGGTRIEPILYTQSGSAPNAQWNTTMSFEDIIPSNTGNVGNYTALFKKTTTNTVTSPNTNLLVTFNSALYGNTYLSSDGYEIPLGAIQDGVNLTFNIQLNVIPEVNILGTYYPVYGNDIEVLLYNTTTNTVVNQQISQVPSTYLVNYSFTLNSSQLQENDIYKVYIKYYNTSQGNTYQVNLFGSFTINQISRLRVLPSITSLKVTQYPLYTQPITSSGVNSIWGYVDTTNYPYVITSSNQTLVELYDSNVKQTDITGSLFNPVTLPWSIKYGDEFRFEGREDFTFMVGKIFNPAYSGSDRITQTGSIEVHFNANLPVSASSSAFNLDHFLIRRYVDDASQILFEGFKPPNSTGPYIVKPEYVTDELNKNIDQIILDLTQKGLL